MNIVYKIISVITSAMLCIVPLHIDAAESIDSGFYDDFSGSQLDTSKWLIAEKNWGGTINVDSETVDYNGGVIAENVQVKDGNLILTGYGDQYEGDIRGINRDGSRRADGKRCGAAIATKEYYGSGSYEIRAKIAPELGCCSAMWTFEYEEDYSVEPFKITNHEIDIEFPGRDLNDDFSLSHALCTTWVTEEDYKTKSVECGNQADGKFHTYRFDWHTGSDTETPRVEYYFDDVLTYTAYEYIPTNTGRFWLGLWFPKYWAGTPDFNTAAFEIDYAKITPFYESGDTPQNETYPDSGWAETENPQDAELPKGWLLWHSYNEYAELDSKLYLRTPDGSIKEISGDFIHAMNGSFGVTPNKVTFMAIDKDEDEWDIYLYDSGIITNLTEKSGFRNEDPKWSPDGKSIVFKRGYWSNTTNDFVYNLALLNVETGEVTMLTDDTAEEAMPCFSEDGKYIYYTSYSNDIGSICRMDTSSHNTETVYAENNVTAYYPITADEDLYFTKCHDADNRCDQIMRYHGSQIYSLPFNSDLFDCSDACPVNENMMIYSSTADGDYDLYFFDGENSMKLTDFCTNKNELGVDFYLLESVQGDVNLDGEFNVADVVLLQKWLLAVPDTYLADWKAADFVADDRLDVFDLCLMKREILRCE